MLFNRSRAQRLMAEQGIAALVATAAENVTYATDYWSMAQWTRPGPQAYALIPADDSLSACLVTSTGALDLLADEGDAWVTETYRYGFFSTRTEGATSEVDRRYARLLGGPDHGDAVKALVAALKDRKLDGARVAVDENGILPANLERLRGELPRAEIVAGARVFRQIRTIKTPEEIARLRGAVRATERSIEAALAVARPGVRELDLQLEFHRATLANGGFPVSICIGTGPRSALSNCQATDRRLEAGDLIRFDGGGRFKHYRCDISRMGSLGEPAEKVRRYYEALRKGMEAGIAQMRAGAKTADVFGTTMATVRAAGIPHYERNHVGHGIGINNYDAPDLKPESTEVLEEGMVMCVETPYYELGFAGLQVEDTVVVRAGGTESLMSLGTELRVV
jgi:Xaa-Pro aminopeptidase